MANFLNYYPHHSISVADSITRKLNYSVSGIAQYQRILVSLEEPSGRFAGKGKQFKKPQRPPCHGCRDALQKSAAGD